MSRTLVHRMLHVVACVLLGASLASAQATRTWVSGVGDDANPCSRTAPCKTFAGAISKTATFGDINVLDGGGFGAVTITKSITINGESEQSAILATLANGINVNGAGVVVVLKHLNITAPNNGLIGIRMFQGASLVVDDVVVTGFATGIQVDAGKALVRNSLFSNNRTVAASAIGGSLTITDSVFANNTMAIISTNAGTVVRISNNDFYNNLTGFGCGGGSIASAGNNRKAGNTGGGVAVCAPDTAITLQ